MKINISLEKSACRRSNDPRGVTAYISALHNDIEYTTADDKQEKHCQARKEDYYV